MSRTRLIRQMSPASTSKVIKVAPAASSTVTVPASPITKVVGWEPYSSAFWAIRPTLGTEPMVAGSRAPWRLCSSTTAAYIRP